MNQTELEQSVLDFVNQPNYKPVKPRIIAKRLGLDEAAAVELKRTVKRLMKSGRLAYGQDHLVLPAATPSVANTEDETVATPARSGKQSRSEFSGERVTGVFRRMNAGYGFVRPAARPRLSIAAAIFSSLPTTRATPRPATPFWSPFPASAIFAGKIPKAKLSKFSSATRTSLSAPISKPPATAMCKSMAPCSRAPCMSAIPGRRMPSPTTKSCSKWSGFPPTFKMAKE